MELIRFGKRIGIKDPNEIITQTFDGVSDTLGLQRDLFDDYPFISRAVQRAMSNCA